MNARITNISVEGYTYKTGVNVYATVSRGGIKEVKDQAHFLKYYGFSEWLEIREALQRPRSKFKGIVQNVIDTLLQRMSKYYDVPPLPEKTGKKKQSKGDDDIESGPSFRSEHETKFDIDSLFEHLKIPDHSMLDTSLPESRPYSDREIVSHPVAGMVFADNDGTLRFLRNKEIQNAPTKLVKMMFYNCWNDNDPMQFQHYFYNKELQRRQEED